MIIRVATEDETWDEVRAIVGDMDIRDTMQREERNMKNDDENMEKEVKVESFTFDHRKVKAPYVRRCCVLDGPNGDKVTKFDLRFCQPNVRLWRRPLCMVLNTCLRRICAVTSTG